MNMVHQSQMISAHNSSRVPKKLDVADAISTVAIYVIYISWLRGVLYSVNIHGIHQVTMIHIIYTLIGADTS